MDTQRAARRWIGLLLACASTVMAQANWATETLDLKDAVVVVRDGERPVGEATAALVLIEEIEERSGIRLPTVTQWPEGKTVIAVATHAGAEAWGRALPQTKPDAPETRPEGYRLLVETKDGAAPVVWVLGADPRGVLFAVGNVLRKAEWGPAKIGIPGDLDIATSPVYPIRGHQLGYRSRANSYDAWSPEQYDRYIRELALFGANSIENIPFEDERENPLMKVSRREMNRKLGEICARYDLDYWVWTPADFDLNDLDKRKKALESHEQFYRDCPRLDHVFFPGGDPGNNHPKLVMPFLKDIAERLKVHHPAAGVWISLQGFDPDDVKYFFECMDENQPDWLRGLAAGPSSPPLPWMRARLDKRYQLRRYSDITHTVRCQFPVKWWDPAFSLTLGRECPNPQPVYYAQMHNAFAPHSDGFLAYSDGIHDDVNKVVWSALGWDPEADVRDVLMDYARFFFGPQDAGLAADGILALEKNWEGPLATNGAVDATLALWLDLEKRNLSLAGNWRWQLCLLRASYDAYTRQRLIYESALEDEANTILAEIDIRGIEGAMQAALETVQRGDTEPIRPDLRRRIDEHCQDLFESIGLQTSVSRYHGSGTERGCVLDLVDYPLNNRWWLEDEFATIRAMTGESEKRDRLEQIRTWENPGPGSFYDDLGNIAKGPHLIRGEGLGTDPLMRRDPNPGYWWWDSGYSRARLSWQWTMDWPLGLRYENLDTEAQYVLRMTGCGQALTRVNGERIQPTLDGKEVGQFKEFPIPGKFIETGAIEITWDVPTDEAHLNWRQQSRVAEVWLLKR